MREAIKYCIGIVLVLCSNCAGTVHLLCWYWSGIVLVLPLVWYWTGTVLPLVWFCTGAVLIPSFIRTWYCWYWTYIVLALYWYRTAAGSLVYWSCAFLGSTGTGMITVVILCWLQVLCILGSGTGIVLLYFYCTGTVLPLVWYFVGAVWIPGAVVRRWQRWVVTK